MPQTNENVIPLPDALQRLALAIKADLASAASSREQWVESMVAAAVKIAQARGMHPGDREFGRWWSEQDFGLGHQDRAALAEMGKQPDVMREVLSATDRSSIRLIFDEARSRFTSAGNARRPAAQRVSPPRRRQPRTAPQAQRSINIDDTDWTALRTRADEMSVSAAELLGRLARRELDGAEEVNPATLSTTARQRLEAAERQMRRRLDAEHAARMQIIDEEVNRRVVSGTDDLRALLNERRSEANRMRDRYEEMANNFRPIFTADEFTAIRRCLHPDSRNSVTTETLAEGFRLFSAKKMQLTGER